MKHTLFIITVVLSVLCLSGCATMNFSANYYTPPAGYQTEVAILFSTLLKSLSLKNTYKLNIVTERESRGLKGIPAMSNKVVILPDNFIKYTFQNYYKDRHKVFTCVIVHEFIHEEFDLPSSPPEKHFETDARTIALLGTKDKETAENYYKSLRVMQSYWFARKGVAGHTFNVGWNVINAGAAVFGLPHAFVDWFATDLSTRLKLIAKHYNINRRSVFRRSESR
ncbi:hypothetical protein ACFL1E_03555 [Candidatus Omnitrophota bacterium]